MTLSEALRDIKAIAQPVFRTADIMAALDVKKSNASQLLNRLAQNGHILRLKRGLWAIPENLEPLSIVQHLTAPFPSYVSLQSALYYHGMISQIPEVIYSVSLARTRIYKTPISTVSVHHIPGSFFFGYEGAKEGQIRMAVPEKALLDTLYLSPSRSRSFAALPEVEFPAKFSIKKSHNMIRKIEDLRRRSMVLNRFEKLLDRRA